ncbi:sensor histidine kinase [Asaia krungthepensis]|uniref:histidine kinase n=1 Tax=Asaia krungthepensis NRIC 0535 TaxID=1307925 RepID=A0ABQ0PY72_9PROT|nr:HWE histidine kinase domain-containing protein [Asaia krungthepensis]GBQ84527.1 signal transduction histidine kinase [Asaia krungthepensis NRIC 0535]
MNRQRDLYDLLSAAAAIARAPAAYFALPERGRPVMAVTFGNLPHVLPAMSAPDKAFVQEVLSPLAELAQAPWHYVFRTAYPIQLMEGQGVATLCFLTRFALDIEAESFREGLEALIRQMVRVLGRPLEAEDQRFSGIEQLPRGHVARLRSAMAGAAPSIEDLPGIGTFEIRFGSNLITLSSELMRLTGVPTGTQCPMDVFAQCMPVPDTDLIHFADGSSDEIILPETDYVMECLSDNTRIWVRRRAEIEADDRGRPWRLIGTIEDITRDRVATNRLSAMVILGDALRKVDTPEEAYHAACFALGDALGADRAGWAMFEPGNDRRFRVMEDWRGLSIPSAAGVYDCARHEVALGVLEQGLLLAVRDARENVWIPCESPLRGEGDQIRAQLLMPIMAQGRMTHCLFVQACQPRDWSDQELAFIRAVSDRAQAAAASLEARAHQQTLHQELAHRLKNTLALVQALANQSLRGVENRAAVKAFEKRLVALGSAHDLLMRQSWQKGDLAALAREVLARVGPVERLYFEGVAVSVGPNTATTLGLMLHELGTNAVKYGALSVETGKVSLTWFIEKVEGRDILRLHWLETGGPPVKSPESSGFGSRLLRAGFGHQGSAELLYPETGCDARFSIPLRQAQEN